MVNGYLTGSLQYTLYQLNKETSEYEEIDKDVSIPNGTYETYSIDDYLLIEGGVDNNGSITPTIENYKIVIKLINSPVVDQTTDLSATFKTGFTLEEGKPKYGKKVMTEAEASSLIFLYKIK